MAYDHQPIRDLHVDQGHAMAFLGVVMDKTRCPVFVYCLNGADRTGFVCAAYRTIVCGWDREEAIREMMESRFGTDVEFGRIPQRLREMDIEAVRKRAEPAK
jgi:protein tyrosine/serine phosphatase